MYLFSRAFLDDLAARLTGPMHFRFILQPAVVILLGIRDGLKDAKAGTPPFTVDLLFESKHRKANFQSALKSLIKPIILGTVIDGISQYLMFGYVRPMAALLVGVGVIALPYALARGITNRVASPRMKQTFALVILIGLAGFASPPGRMLAQAPAAAAEAPQSAKIWVDRRHDVEEYLRHAEVVKIDAIGVGVTSPRRAYLAPGGLFDSFTWKAIPPGRYKGYWESYKSEIAAYQLDQLLDIDMMAPAVEREVNGEVGAAVMWVSPTKSFREFGRVPTPPPAMADMWARQIIKAKMIDNLIANTDPNLGNWLVDPAWNIILIDHSRAFTDTQKMTHEMTHISSAIWDRMKALDDKQLTTSLGKWLSADAIGSMLKRRDKMQTIIDKMVKKRGRARVFVS